MLISHIKKFIYTKTLKTAGSTVEIYFEPYCLPENEWTFSRKRDMYIGETGIVGYRGPYSSKIRWYNHMSAEKIKNQLNNNYIWENYLKFCVIRNPFDKLVSMFHYHEYVYQNMKLFKDFRSLRKIQWKMLTSTGGTVKRFRNWIIRRNFISKTFSLSGIPYDGKIYLINDKSCMDYFIRFEYLRKDMNELCKILNIPFDEKRMMQLKSGIRPQNKLKLNEYYDKTTVNIVKEIYKWEIDRFNYPLPL